MLFEETDKEKSEEVSTFMEPVVAKRLSTGGDAKVEDIVAYTAAALTALYTTEVQKQIDMDRYKTSAKVSSLDPGANELGCPNHQLSLRSPRSASLARSPRSRRCRWRWTSPP
jgi:hypothetical protein